MILGHSVVGQLSTDEIAKRGWSDHLLGKQLIEVNEFSKDGNFDWLSWIKRNCNEAFLQISIRGSTPVSVINSGNYIFALNPRRGQSLIDGITSNDRRNHMIETTADKRWVGFASRIRGDATHRPVEYAEGFAHVLEQVSVDFASIRYSFINDFKRKVIESHSDAITVWLNHDLTVQKREYQSNELYETYKTWHNANGGSDRLMNIKVWGTLMKGHRCVRHESRRNLVYYSIQEPEVENTIPWAEVDAEFALLSPDAVPIEHKDAAIPEEQLPTATKMSMVRELLRRNAARDDR
jgi:hypothetical protein